MSDQIKSIRFQYLLVLQSTDSFFWSNKRYVTNDDSDQILFSYLSLSSKFLFFSLSFFHVSLFFLYFFLSLSLYFCILFPKSLSIQFIFSFRYTNPWSLFLTFFFLFRSTGTWERNHNRRMSTVKRGGRESREEWIHFVGSLLGFITFLLPLFSRYLLSLTLSFSPPSSSSPCCLLLYLPVPTSFDIDSLIPLLSLSLSLRMCLPHFLFGQSTPKLRMFATLLSQYIP